MRWGWDGCCLLWLEPLPSQGEACGDSGLVVTVESGVFRVFLGGRGQWSGSMGGGYCGGWGSIIVYFCFRITPPAPERVKETPDSNMKY